jgi:hypothetical protein
MTYIRVKLTRKTVLLSIVVVREVWLKTNCSLRDWALVITFPSFLTDKITYINKRNF